MAKLFDIDRNKINLNPDVLAIPIIKKIWNRDKSKEKEKAIKEISYIVFLCDFHSPYRDIISKNKESIIIEDVFNTSWLPDETILKAIKVYNKMQETPSMRLLKSAKNTLDKLSSYFDNIDFSEEDIMGKPKYSATDLTRNLKEVGNIVKSLVSLEKQVRLELEEQSIRGDSEVGYFEDPKK